MSSGGKDSLLALARLRAAGWDVRSLVAHLDEGERTLARHGLPEVLLEAQAASLGLPLEKVFMRSAPPNALYDAAIGAALSAWRERGVRHVAFGDLFLEDVRAYRDALLGSLGLTGVYPLWGDDSRALAAGVARDWRALVVCVDEAQLPGEFAGRDFDAALLAALPRHVDPCGENGEFHTFVTDGPGFAFSLPVRVSACTSDGRFTLAVLSMAAMDCCTACGAPFACGMRTQVDRCWCTRLPPVEIAAPAAGCLCPRCLQATLSASSCRGAPDLPAP